LVETTLSFGHAAPVARTEIAAGLQVLAYDSKQQRETGHAENYSELKQKAELKMHRQPDGCALKLKMRSASTTVSRQRADCSP